MGADRWRLSLRQRFAVLVAGAIGAQAIPALAAPLMTRLYSPHDYGVFAVISGLAAIGVSMAAGRYGMAIMLPSSDDTAQSLLQLCYALIALTSGLVLVIVAVMQVVGLRPGPLEDAGLWIFFVPALMAAGATYEVAQSIALRRDAHATVGATNSLRALAGTGTQLALGLAHMGKAGLICGALAGNVCGFRRLLRTGPAQRKHSEWGDLRTVARCYVRFPKYDLPANLASIGAVSLVPIGVAFLYSPVDAGYYSLAYRLLSLPAALVGTAAAQMYFREASRQTQRERLRMFRAVTYALTAAAVAFLSIGYLSFEHLFAVAFGRDWHVAGSVACAMLPLTAFRLVTSPMSTSFLVLERQHELMGIQLAILVATIASLAIAAHWDLQLVEFLYAQAALVGPIYLAQHLRVFVLLRRST